MSSIRSSRFYNSPQIGAALEGIASMFAPPSAQDTYAYAKARAEREDAARRQAVYDYANDPNYDSSVADRKAAAAGVYTPLQSFYAIDQGNMTARRGQDVVASTTLATNAADNTRALEDRRMQEAGSLQRFYATPVVAKPGERVFLPNQTAAVTGLPGQLDGKEAPLTESQQLAQIISNMPRERQTQLVDNKFAPTETQVQGRLLEGLRNGGLLTDEMVGDRYAGEKAPVEIIGPDGKPRYASPGAAVRAGATPYNSPGVGAKHSTYVAVLPDGSRVTAVQGPDGTIRHAQTGQKLPDQVQLYDVPKPQGSAADIGLGPTTANTTAANQQEAEVVRNLGVLDAYEALVRNNPGAVGLAGLIRGTVQNVGSTANDLVRSFGDRAPQMEAAAQELQKGLKAIDPGVFDPSIPEAQFLQSTLAYGLVRSENPSGEVSRQAYEDALRRVQGGGLLANSDSALAAVAAQRKILANQLTGLRTLRNPGTGRTDTTFQAPAGASAEPAVAPLRKRYNPTTGAFE